MPKPATPPALIPLITFLPKANQFTRLQEALGNRYQILKAASWSNLLELVESHTVAAIVFDLCAETEPNFAILRSLRATYPKTALVAYQDKSISMEHVFDLGRLQIKGLIIANQTDSIAEISSLMDRAAARTISYEVRLRLKNTSAVVRDAVMISLVRASECLTPDLLAQSLNMSARTLNKHLAEANLPSPPALLTWGRLIVASSLLETGLRSADSVASSLDFPSPSAFRNTCQRYLQTTPHGIRDCGGTDWVITRMFTKGAQDHLHHEEEETPAA